MSSCPGHYPEPPDLVVEPAADRVNQAIDRREYSPDFYDEALRVEIVNIKLEQGGRADLLIADRAVMAIMTDESEA